MSQSPAVLPDELAYPRGSSHSTSRSVANGLPTGMQIIGRRNADIDALAASAAFERLRPWHENYRVCRERPLHARGRGALAWRKI